MKKKHSYFRNLLTKVMNNSFSQFNVKSNILLNWPEEYTILLLAFASNFRQIVLRRLDVANF